MALILSPEPMPVEVMAALVVAAVEAGVAEVVELVVDVGVVEAVEAAPEMLELMRNARPFQ